MKTTTLFLRYFLIILFTTLLSNNCYSQHRTNKTKKVKYRFNAGLVLGINLSQIDGDHFNGFNKKGIKAGISSLIYLNRKFDIYTSILYVQKGSTFPYEYPLSASDNEKRVIHLDYVELPIMLSYKIRGQNNSSFRLDVGGSYGRLVNSRVREIKTREREFQYGPLQKAFRNVEYNTKLALTYFINRHLGFGCSFTLQMNRFYKNPVRVQQDPNTWLSEPNREVEHMRNFQLGIYTTYLFFK